MNHRKRRRSWPAVAACAFAMVAAGMMAKAVADEAWDILGKWEWSSGLGPAVISASSVAADGTVTGSYSLTQHPQHTSVFGSPDGSTATYRSGLLSIRLKSGSSFELVRKKDQLIGDFTFSRDGSTTEVVFDRALDPAQAIGGSGSIVLTALVVDPVLRAGRRYDVALRFTGAGDPDIDEVCFRWSGEGPYCWKEFSVDRGDGEVRTRAITRNPNTYDLEGFVRYREGGKRLESNRVSARIDVR